MTDRMRVAHVVSSLKVGGAERLVLDLASAQLRAGLEVSIVDLGVDEQPLAATARELGIDVIRLGQRRSRIARIAMLARLFAGRTHVLHVHNPWALRAVLPILPVARGKVVYTRHGPSPYRQRAWRVVHRLARPFVDHVTFVSAQAREAFEGVHGASPERHMIVENGVVVPSSVAGPASAARLRIGTVGRLVELKGHWRALEAVAGLTPAERARAEIHLFGDGPERDRLTQLARDRLEGTSVAFHGMVLDREKIYASIDVLVVGSRMEGQSLAIMEAMARGVPVIATNVGGNGELVRDGETGVLVPAGGTDAIRDALARMIADPAWIQQLGRGGRALIHAHHSIDGVAAKYRALYAPS